jgi:cytochrome c oxidase cbb3-type subunit IV
MLSGIITVILLVAFLGGAVWVFSPRRTPEFDAAARIPLEDQSETLP